MRNKEIDFLRAYGVVFVFVLHLGLIAAPIYNFEFRLARYFSLEVGVDLFFAISGFVIASAYARLHTELKGVELYLTYLCRRFKRLWLPAFFWLSYCLVASYLFSDYFIYPDFHSVLKKWLSGIFYIYNFHEYTNQSVLGYFWSLSVEWQFYMTMPIFFLLERRARLVLIIVLLAAMLFYRPGGSGWWMFRFDGILSGILIWDVFKNSRIFIKYELIGRLLSWLLMAGLLIIVLVMNILIDDRYVAKVLQSVFSGLLVLLATLQFKIIIPLFSSKIWGWVGLRSYSIYLSHIPVILTTVIGFKWVGYLPNMWLFTLFVLIGTVLVSEMSYRWLERPVSYFEFFKVEYQKI